MPDIHALILKRLAKLKWTPYRLAKEVEPNGVSKQTVYDYLSGRSPINSVYLGYLLDAVGLDVKEKR